MRWLLLVPVLLALFGSSAYGFYDASVGRWLNRDPIQESGGINLYQFSKNSPLEVIDLFGWGTWNVAEATVDLTRSDVDPRATNPYGFEVIYTPDAAECPDGKVVLYQVTSSLGLNRRTAHVDGTPPQGTCKLPPQMRPLGRAGCSYQDAPQGGGVSTFRQTAVAVCRKNCKDTVLGTYYFEFSNSKREVTKRDPNKKDHFENGMKDWVKKGGNQ